MIVSVNFHSLTGQAIAAALYELSDMRPKNICLTVAQNSIFQVLFGFYSAFKRICEIFANASIRENGSDMPWLPGGTGGRSEMKQQSHPETYQHAS